MYFLFVIIQVILGLFIGLPIIAFIFGVVLYFFRPFERLLVGILLVVLGVVGFMIYFPFSFFVFVEGNRFGFIFVGLLFVEVLMVVVGVLCLRNRIKEKPQS